MDTQVAGIMILIAIVATLWRAFVLTILWKWFVVAPFHAPQLGMGTAIGITTIISLLFMQDQTSEKEGSGSYISWAVAPLIYLFMGWVVVQFM